MFSSSMFVSFIWTYKEKKAFLTPTHLCFDSKLAHVQVQRCFFVAHRRFHSVSFFHCYREHIKQMNENLMSLCQITLFCQCLLSKSEKRKRLQERLQLSLSLPTTNFLSLSSLVTSTLLFNTFSAALRICWVMTESLEIPQRETRMLPSGRP